MGKVSIVITTYQRPAELLKQAINSALNQTYPNTEIVVVDDNKDPALSEKIQQCVEASGEKVKYLGYEGNHGACYARNLGADSTDGKYIAFLDDDDIWYPNKIEKQVEYLEKNDCLMVSCNSYRVIVDDKRREKKRVRNIRHPGGQIGMEELLNKNVVGGCSFPLIKRTAFNQAGKFTVGLPASQDYDLWIRIRKLGEVGHIEEPLLDYYVFPGDSITKNTAKKIQSYTYLIENYGDLAADKKRFRAEKYFALASICFARADFHDGGKYWLTALKADGSVKNLGKALNALNSVVKGTVKIIIGHRSRKDT